MEKITEFDRDNLKELRPEIQAVLDLIKDEYGVKLTIGPIRFDKGHFTTRLTGTIDGAASPDTIEQGDIAFEFNAVSLGLPKDCRGFRFGYSGKMFRIDSINLRAKRFPVVCVREADGRKFKFSVQLLKAALKVE